MAEYKVLQDIEAEDKLVGPLTLKQFIFAIITMVLIAIAVFFGRVNVFLAIPWLIPICFFGFMASPIGRDQPNDVWLAARIRFMIKPRKRRWDQSGMQELVTITAPKKEEFSRTDNLSQTQVKSRLKALASTLDSHGWAVKNVNVSMGEQAYALADNSSDRLINVSSIQSQEEVVDVHAEDDILDPANNRVAQRFDVAIKQQHDDRMQKLKTSIKETKAETPDYSFITNPSVEPGYTTFGAQVIAPTSSKVKQTDSFIEESPSEPDNDEAAFLEKQKKRKKIERQIQSHGHEKVILPLDEQAELEKEQAEEAAKRQEEAAKEPPRLNPVPLPSTAPYINPQPMPYPQQSQPIQSPMAAQPFAQTQPYYPGGTVAGQSQYAGMTPLYDPQYYPVAPPAEILQNANVNPPQKAPDDILEELGQSNDLSVASLASLAKHAEKEAALHDGDDIPLH